jgi:dihydroorotate dehydrogenase (fumarate)
MENNIMVDLSTTYLGLNLKNPLVASPSPLSERIDHIKNLEAAGVSAIVMYSLFEEQIIHESLELDHYLSHGTDTYSEALSYFPNTGKYSLTPDNYIEHLNKVKRAVNIPVIGSLNGVSSGGWIRYAKEIQDAGADALELNIYFLPNDPALTSADLEQNYVTLVKDVCAQVSIPVAVKISPFFTALPNLASQLAGAGAKGLVLFNRFYQPDFDLEELEVVPHLVLSNSHEMRLPLRWVAILYGHVKASLALTTGIHSTDDAVKAIMAGADVANVASLLLERGAGAITDLVSGVSRWMEEHEYESVAQMKGALSQQNVAEPAAFERANYMKVLGSWK